MAAAQQDIAIVAEAFTLSYINALIPTSPSSTIPSRAANMATHYLPNTVSLVCGSITQTTNPAPEFPAQATIATALENLKADRVPLEVTGHRVEVAGLNSAICWISLRRKETKWTNVYFFRREEGENGKVGFEGGIFDGEVAVAREVAEEE